jgi:HSP90 family molecular chaperone
MTTSTSTITHTFEADIQKILHILIRSVYSNRDVFLRELISNASDAIDKVRVLKMNANEDTKGEYNIHVRVLEGNVLEIFDNGIGMDVDDLQKNLSTIAHSGTSDFAEKLKDKKDMSQFIGQFGVGFYSCFLISSNVEVLTRKWNTNKVWKWTSDGVSTYSVEEYDGDWSGDMTHGTFIRLQLKEDSEEYGKEETLKKIIQQHSSFISYPVKLWVEKEKEEEKPTLDTVEEEDGEEEVVVEEVDGEETTKEPEKTMVKYNEWEQVNGAKPLWYKEPSEITNEEYTELFRTMKKASNPADCPLYWKHFKAEGKHEFQGVFYFSSRPTTDAFIPHNTPEKNIRLYVKKVMIMENCGKELIPDWMCFVSGIVDSNDLPLNVSREMLQNNQMVRSMKNYMIKQVHKMLGDFLTDDRTKYEVFYSANSHFLKWGITEKEPKLMDYLMFTTSLDTSKKITLDEYIENHLVEGQKDIFFMTGDTVDEIEKSIFLERFKERNICVLYLTDPIDEFIMQHVRSHKEHTFVDIGKEFESTLFDDLKEGKTVETATKACLYKKPKDNTTEKDGEETVESETADVVEEEPRRPFLEFLMECLQNESIDEIRQSVRLTSTPACLVTKKYGWTGHMTKIMKSQPLQDKSYLMMANLPKSWEVNLDHKLIVDLKTKYEEETVSNDELSKRVNVLYKITTVQSGYPLEDTPSFCKDLFEMLENPL